MNDNAPVLIHSRTQRNGDQVAQTWAAAGSVGTNLSFGCFIVF